MNEFTINPNNFLSKRIQAFYHTDYLGYRKPGNPDYINTLKNTYNDFSCRKLYPAVRELSHVLHEDLLSILRRTKYNLLLVCVVPRAKASYEPNQLLFKTTVRNALDQFDGLNDGIDSILRHTNTKTTHLGSNTPNYHNDDDMPYPGITIRTCNIANDVNGRDILLIDDIYTSNINIDEDAIQALFDCGARSVIFYAVGKTIEYRSYK